MSSIPEQLAAAAKAHVETQFQLLNTLTAKALEGVEKVVELNLNTAKEALAETPKAVGDMVGKDAQALGAQSAADLQRAADKVGEYSRRLAEIGDAVYDQFTKSAEAQVAENRKKLAALIDEAAKKAPPGSENTIAGMKSLLASADAGYEQILKNAKQAAETLKSNIAAAGERFAQAGRDAAGGRGK